MIRLMILYVLCGTTAAVIYKLNETEYNKMPRLYELDDYNNCLLEPGGMYCVVDINLYSNNGSKLMNTIKEYSAYRKKHFNYTQIHRGICVDTTCQKYIGKSKVDLSETLGACLNNSLWENYGIESNISVIQYCINEGDTTKLDASDIAMIIVYCILIVFNVVGSLYDVCKSNNDKKTGNKYLLAFSLRQNWIKLTSPVSAGTDLRLERLKLFHGLRTMTMICVFFSHTVLMTAYSYVDNPLYIETAYEDPLKQILFNGTLVTHTFFVMSSFLLAYNFEIYSETHQITWMQLPKGIVQRWLRLTPTYALVLGTISTIMRHAGTGPLWQHVVVSESLACRQYWWAHLLYINNYIYEDAFCVPQTWYLAADTQLFCIGLMVCIFARTRETKIPTLLILFGLSLLIPAAHTYFQHLDAVVLQSPEVYRSLYAQDNTFRLLYSRGHTNLSTYVLGLAGGFLTYQWQKDGKNFKQYKNYRQLIWVLFPLGVAVILSGGVFYLDSWNPSTGLQVLYATTYKPIFQFLVVIFIISCVFKVEGDQNSTGNEVRRRSSNEKRYIIAFTIAILTWVCCFSTHDRPMKFSIYRGIVEWRGFAWTGRVSYSAFLLHTLFQRGYIGIQTTPIHISEYYVLLFLSATIFVTYGTAVILWLCVEAPVSGLTRAIMSPPVNKSTDNENHEVESSKI